MAREMARVLAACCALCAIIGTGRSVSTKMDFDDDSEPSSPVSDAAREDEDVEVKHTIVFSTRLKSNNWRGLHGADGVGGPLTHTTGYESNVKKEDSNEVPIIKGYKSVESTLIRTPDSRDTPALTGAVLVNRGVGGGYGSYPVASIPAQWKPSSFFNNVNWWSDDNVAGFNNFAKRSGWAANRNEQTFHRAVTDDGVKEFYCRKCRELSGSSATRRCVQPRNNWSYESTTPKIKLDGKLARLN